MHSLKRDLAIGGAIGAMVLALAMAWGSPFATASSAHAQDQAQPPQQQQPQPAPDQAQPQAPPDQAQPQQPAQPDQSKSATFTGTIVQSGNQFALRDSSGQVFKLDDPDRAKPYVGKTVKVTGQLDEQAMVIHVESIQGTEA
jgi:uncharacterized protein YdeI (BOF family)